MEPECVCVCVCVCVYPLRGTGDRLVSYLLPWRLSTGLGVSQRRCLAYPLLQETGPLTAQPAPRHLPSPQRHPPSSFELLQP